MCFFFSLNDGFEFSVTDKSGDDHEWDTKSNFRIGVEIHMWTKNIDEEKQKKRSNAWYENGAGWQGVRRGIDMGAMT